MRPFVWETDRSAPQATNPDGVGRNEPSHPYSVLLPVGFAVPAAVAGAAVSSYPTLSLSQGRSLCDLLSVALSLGSPPPDVIRHRRSVEPGLSSARLRETRPPDPLAGAT